MKRQGTLILGATLCLIMLFHTLSGCSSASRPVTPPQGKGWSQEIEEGRTKAKGTPHEESTLKILEDEQVSEAEEMELRSKVTKCMHDAGVTSFRYNPDGSYETTYDPKDPEGKLVNQAEFTCDDEIGHIFLMGLRNGMVSNPTNVDPSALYAYCFVQKGIVEPSYSADDFNRDMEKFTKEHANDQAEEGDSLTDHLPYIVDKEKGITAAEDCMNNPNQTQSGAQ